MYDVDVGVAVNAAHDPLAVNLNLLLTVLEARPSTTTGGVSSSRGGPSDQPDALEAEAVAVVLDIVELFRARGHGLPNREAGKFELWYAPKDNIQGRKRDSLRRISYCLGRQVLRKIPNVGALATRPRNFSTSVAAGRQRWCFLCEQVFPGLLLSRERPALVVVKPA